MDRGNLEGVDGRGLTQRLTKYNDTILSFRCGLYCPLGSGQLRDKFLLQYAQECLTRRRRLCL